MNESLNVNLYMEYWTYWKSPLKQEKHPYKWSTIKYNNINTGPSQSIIWSVLASKYGPLARVEKQAMW